VFRVGKCVAQDVAAVATSCATRSRDTKLKPARWRMCRAHYKITKNFTSMYVYAFMVCAFSARTLFPKNSECVLRKKNRREFYYGLFSRKRNYGNETHAPRHKNKQAPVWRSPQKALAQTHTKEQYKTPHVQCLCTRVWETHIIGYQFDNEAGSEARFSFADCFLGVSRRAAACHSSCAFHLCVE
jgi:hypothetical protein